jgi:hypothetical protein
MSSGALTGKTLVVSSMSVGGIPVPPGGSGLRLTVGYNTVFTWTNASTPPTLSGILIEDISHLIPYFGSAVPPTALPTISVLAGNVICGYNLAQEDSTTPAPFPATGTLFFYLSADNSTLQDAGTIIVNTIPFSSLAELINDLDNVTPTDFVVSCFGSIPSSTTSLRLMAYYSPPTEASWSAKFSLGVCGVQPINAVLSTPPTPPS